MSQNVASNSDRVIIDLSDGCLQKNEVAAFLEAFSFEDRGSSCYAIPDGWNLIDQVTQKSIYDDRGRLRALYIHGRLTILPAIVIYQVKEEDQSVATFTFSKCGLNDFPTFTASISEFGDHARAVALERVVDFVEERFPGFRDDFTLYWS